MSADTFTEEQRRALFAALVEAQDTGASVRESREGVALRFGIDTAEVFRIEREGIEANWPPLGD